MKLNLGCGKDYRPGYVNVDVLPGVGADVVRDITQTLPWADGGVEEVVAQDVLEHLTLEQQRGVLGEIARVLQPNGRLVCRLPNVDDIIERFAADVEVRNLFLYGDTRESGVWGAHKSAHTPVTFTALALRMGLKLVQIRSVDTNFEFAFVKAPVDLSVHQITFINQTLGVGGAETFNAQLLKWWGRKKIAISAYVAGKVFWPAARPIPVVVDLIGNWKGLIKGLVLVPLAAVYYLGLVLHERKTDVVFMTGFIEKILVTPWARLLNTPVVWEEFGPLETIFKKFFGLPKLLYLLVKDLPDYVVVPSQHTLRSLVTSAHVSSAKLVVVPCARDLTPTKYQRPGARSLTVVCVSRLEKGKGQDVLLEAWPDVVKQMPGARLRLVGAGDRYPELKSQISALKLTGSAVLTGYVPDALVEIAKSQICVCPSLWPLEGFGLVAVEAMALGKPVVGFDCPPLSEIVDSSCGILVPPNDRLALANAIVKLLQHPRLAATLGQAGQAKYRRRYSLEKVGPSYLELFEQALARKVARELLSSTP